MASSDPQGRQEEDPSERIVQSSSGEGQDIHRIARLVGERTWPEFEFIDILRYNEGEFVGYFLGSPYDWNVLDPNLMEKESHADR